jgi:hypothetical protein
MPAQSGISLSAIAPVPVLPHSERRHLDRPGRLTTIDHDIASSDVVDRLSWTVCLGGVWVPGGLPGLQNQCAGESWRAGSIPVPLREKGPHDMTAPTMRAEVRLTKFSHGAG